MVKTRIKLLLLALTGVILVSSGLSSQPTVEGTLLNESNISNQVQETLKAASEAAANSTAKAQTQDRLNATNRAEEILKLASEASANATAKAMNEANELINLASNALENGSNPFMVELFQPEYDSCKPTGDDASSAITNKNSNSTESYTNNTYQFSIEYPINWKVEQEQSCLPHTSSVVSFSVTNEFPITEPASFEDMMNILYYRTVLWVDISNLAEPYLHTDTMTLKNYTAQHYAQSRLHSLSESPTEENFREIRENEFTLASQPAWKIEYWLDDPSKSTYNFEIYSIAEGRLFVLHYRALPMNVPTTIPLVNNMIGSFEFFG